MYRVWHARMNTGMDQGVSSLNAPLEAMMVTLQHIPTCITFQSLPDTHKHDCGFSTIVCV